jgi:hypothetical protein
MVGSCEKALMANKDNLARERELANPEISSEESDAGG